MIPSHPRQIDMPLCKFSTKIGLHGEHKLRGEKKKATHMANKNKKPQKISLNPIQAMK